MNITENLKWRYATKKFDKSKKVSSENLEKLKEAVQLSVSSFGLQLYKILIIENLEIREKLREASWGQPQITDASHLFVFCNYTEFKDSDVDDYIKTKAKIQNIEVNDLTKFSEYLKGALSAHTPQTYSNWTSKQTYIALSTLIAAASELKIDNCPMEGFEPEKYNKILGLDKRGLNASVITAIGYRSTEDETQFAKKVRKPSENLFEII